jgi:hypothetical protein
MSPVNRTLRESATCRTRRAVTDASVGARSGRYAALKQRGPLRGPSGVRGHDPTAPEKGKVSFAGLFLRWRDPDSNRGHHDFQSGTGLRSVEECGGWRAILPCKSTGSDSRRISEFISCVRGRVGEVLARVCAVLPDRTLAAGIVPVRLRRAPRRSEPRPCGRGQSATDGENPMSIESGGLTSTRGGCRDQTGRALWEGSAMTRRSSSSVRPGRVRRATDKPVDQVAPERYTRSAWLRSSGSSDGGSPRRRSPPSLALPGRRSTSTALTRLASAASGSGVTGGRVEDAGGRRAAAAAGSGRRTGAAVVRRPGGVAGATGGCSMRSARERS